MSLKQFEKWLHEHGVAQKNGRYYIPCAGSATNGGSDATLAVTISTRDKDRHGDVLEPGGMDAEGFRKNPVVLWAHRYDELPIARATQVWSDGHSIMATVHFDSRPFAQEVLRLYREGFLGGWSVGFLPRKWDVIEGKDGKFDGYHVSQWELVELSAVPVPANPAALTRELRSGTIRTPALRKEIAAELDGIQPRSAIPFKETPKDPEDSEWDAAEEVAKADVQDLRVMCAWFDSEHADLKSSYKLPHHRAANHHVVWNGAKAAMNALFGARGGVDIPKSDQEGVYRHLAAHYRQFDKEAPEFSALSVDPASRDNAVAQPVSNSLPAGCMASLPAPEDANAESSPSRPGTCAAPEVSPEAFAAALFPPLWKKLQEWAERAAAREIRRRLGRLD